MGKINIIVAYTHRLWGWWDLINQAFVCLIEIIHVHDDTKYHIIPTECTFIAVYSNELYWYFIVLYGILFSYTVSMRYKNVNLFFNGVISKSYCTGCPTRYRTRQFFNNSNTNEDTAMKFKQEYVAFFYISYTMR